MCHRLEDAEQRVAVKRRATGDALVQDDAKRILIGLGREIARAANGLGRHVHRAAHELTDGRRRRIERAQGIGQLRDAEVEQLGHDLAVGPAR
ncbi:MAG TPA: hypothetical protein VMG12_18155, partial [Polyangiaceae bacterium]|nr:hypothetical protein [Polyangiaceae bacterium]